MTFLANPHFTLQNSHAKTFKMKYTRCQYNNNIIQKKSHKDRLCVVRIFMNRRLLSYPTPTKNLECWSIIRSPPPVQQQPQPPQQQQIIRSQVQQTPAPASAVAPTSGAATNTITVGPDQQQVFYTVSGEDGKTQQYMMLCPKDMDQNTLITTLVRQISADPTNKGKKTIRITQYKSSPGGTYRIHLVFLRDFA